MTPELILSEAASVAALVAAVTAVFVAVRAGSWRKGAEGKALEARLSSAERWQESEAGKNMVKAVETAHRRIDHHDKDLAKITANIEALPSADDFADLKAEIGEVAAIGKRTEAGIGRLEGYFLRRGVEGVS